MPDKTSHPARPVAHRAPVRGAQVEQVKMSMVQPGRFRTLVIAVALFFAFVSAVLGMTMRELGRVPDDAALQAAIASVRLEDTQRAVHTAPSSRPLSVEERVLADSEQWRARLNSLDAAVGR